MKVELKDAEGNTCRGAHDPLPSGKVQLPGKTEREKKNGKWARHLQNQDEKRELNRKQGR